MTPEEMELCLEHGAQCVDTSHQEGCNAGAQLASDLGKGLIQGTSQYIAKKMRTVKVHLKAGYRVMLYQEKY